MTNEEKKDKLKSVLLKSYSEERMLIDTLMPHYDTLQQCLETIQNYERLINSGKLSVLHHSAMQGEAVFHIKQKPKKGQKYDIFTW